MIAHLCVLVRHGETEWSRNGRHTGRTDLPLISEGENQAKALAATVSAQEFALILCSPLLRARQTGELAGLGDGAVIDPDLAEWDYGEYEGLTTPEIRRERPGWDLFEDGAPGGESAEEVGTRADRVIERVRAAPGDVVCVAHGHLLRVLAARWLGLEARAARYFALGPASVSELGWEREQPVIASWNLRLEPPQMGEEES
jgi:broad specificity phosphatase PhoE